MPFLDEIAAQLVAQGVGVVGGNIFLGSKAVIPTGDGPYLVLIETGGSKPVNTQNDTALQRPTAQLSVRALSYQVARTMLKNAYEALGGAAGLDNVTLSGVKYLSISPRQEPTDIGLDGNARPMIVFNIDAVKQPS